MAKAKGVFGVSSKNLDSDLAEFYKAAEEAILKNNPGLKNELKYYSKLPLHLVPFEERGALINKYRKAIGLDKALMSFAGNDIPVNPNVGAGVAPDHRAGVSGIFSSLRTDMSIDDPNAFGRLPVAENVGNRKLSKSDRKLANIYSSLNVQFRSILMPDRGGLITSGKDDVGRVVSAEALESSYFTIGLNSIPSEMSMRTPEYTPGMLQGKSRLIYDVETAGLAKGQIREVSYSLDGKSNQIFFNPDEFNRGLVNVDGRASNLTDFLRNRFGFKIPGRTSGNQFAEGMRPFLEAVVGTDFIVGHNITGFDNEQVFVGLSRTEKYQKDASFRTLVDDAFKKIETSSVDTLTIARGMPTLSTLSAAKELADKGNFSVYSIENLLLKTDLIDHLGGLDAFETLLGDTGLHHANVDVAVTEAIISAAESGGLRPKDLLGQGAPGSGTTPASRRQAARVKELILSSSAITPVTNITETGQLTDDVLRHLVDTYSQTDDPSLVTPKGSRLDELLRGSPAQRQEAYDKLRSGRLTPQRIRLNPIEQQILSERRLTVDSVNGDAGIVARVSARFKINTAKDVQTAQRFSREAGIPFAGLSGDERSIAFGVSRATATISNLADLSPMDAKVAGLASDLGVSRFTTFGPTNVQYLGKSGRASLPFGIVSDSRLSGIFKEGDLLNLSVVEGNSGNKGGSINLVKYLNDQEQATLKSFLNDLSGMGDEDVAKVLGYTGDYTSSEVAQVGVQRFRESMSRGLVDSIGEKGVSIGQIYGSDNKGVISQVTDIFRKFFNVEGQLNDKSMQSIGFPLMDIDKDTKIVRTAGAVLDKGLGGSERSVLRSAVRATRIEHSKIIEASNVEPGTFRLAKKISDLSGQMDSELVQKAFSTVQNQIIPNLGKGLAGVVAVGAGALLFSRHKENQRLNETLDFQGWESSTEGQYAIYEQLQMQQEAGYDGYSNLMDPLATASLTNSLNDSRTGHHNYDWDRNNSIYGGVL